jgi:hypothetical protein
MPDMPDFNPISSVKLRWLPDITTDMTTSHLTNPAKDAGQVIGYSHSTRLSKDDRQVAGYRSLLMKQLAIRLSYQNTIAKSLVITVLVALSASLACRRPFDWAQDRLV